MLVGDADRLYRMPDRDARLRDLPVMFLVANKTGTRGWADHDAFMSAEHRARFKPIHTISNCTYALAEAALETPMVVQTTET